MKSNQDDRRWSPSWVSFILVVLAAVSVPFLVKLEWVDQSQVDYAILALLAALATFGANAIYQDFKRTNRKIEQLGLLMLGKFDQVMDAIGEINILEFPTPEEGFDYLAKKIDDVDSHVFHAAFAPHIPSRPQSKREYERAMEKIMKDNKEYYYITGLDRDEASFDRLNRIDKLLSDGDTGRYYHPSCFDYTSDPEPTSDSFPGFSFVIFDDEELIAYYPYRENISDVAFRTRHEGLVGIYCGYFKRLRRGSTPLKGNPEEVGRLLQELEPYANEQNQS